MMNDDLFPSMFFFILFIIFCFLLLKSTYHCDRETEFLKEKCIKGGNSKEKHDPEYKDIVDGKQQLVCKKCNKSISLDR